MEKYLLSESVTPFIIHGESGCGKTSLIAKIEQTVSEKKHQNTSTNSKLFNFLDFRLRSRS